MSRLVAALNSGDLQGLMDVLAPDVVSGGDGGGKVQGAARRPVVGADKVARYVLGGMAKARGAVAARVNGEPGIRMEMGGRVLAVLGVAIDGGRITRIFSIANPDKLGRIDEEATVSR